MPTTLLATLGPVSLDPVTIHRLDECGVDIFRINLSHTRLEDLPGFVALIRDATDKPICIDTEGAQIRCGYMLPDVALTERSRVILTGQDVQGDAGLLPVHPSDWLDSVAPNTLVTVDFDSVLLRILSASPGYAEAEVVVGGRVESNRAMNAFPSPHLEMLTPKDREGIRIALSLGIRYFALSFASSGEDVEALRALVGAESTIIAKVESVAAVRHLEGIAQAADAIIIDRGDLSREVAVENIPLLQQEIIRVAAVARTPAYVATNLLETMVKSRTPTRAEVNDIASCLQAGASGLVLAAETAVGAYPVRAAEIVAAVARRHDLSKEGIRREDLCDYDSVLLPRPHGSARVDLPVVGFSDAQQLPAFDVDGAAVLALEALRSGRLRPLQGFMGLSEAASVLNRWELLNSVPWPQPITLVVSDHEAAGLAVGARVALRNPRGHLCATLRVDEIVRLDPGALRLTMPADHEVTRGLLMGGRGGVMISGPVAAVDDPAARSSPALTADGVRRIFGLKGWTRVVGVDADAIDDAAVRLLQTVLATHECDGVLLATRSATTEGAPMASAGADRLGALLGGRMISATCPGRPMVDARTACLTALEMKNCGCSRVLIPASLDGAERDLAVDWMRSIGLRVLKPAEPAAASES